MRTIFLSSTTNNRGLLLFYNCTSEDRRSIPNNFTCKIGGIESVGFHADETLFNELQNSQRTTISCNQSVEVQVFPHTVAEVLEKSVTLKQGLRGGFEVVYEANIETARARCEGSGRTCGSDWSEFACHCCDRTDPTATCQSPGMQPLYFLIRLFQMIQLHFLRMVNSCCSLLDYRTTCFQTVNFVPAFPIDSIQFRWACDFVFHAIPRQLLDNSCNPGAVAKFSDQKLGMNSDDQGNNQILPSFMEYTWIVVTHRDKWNIGRKVAIGKLKDGRDVAVKRLYEHNYKRMEQFMNEVEILARLRHINLVSLYGCTSRHCRELLLVYEYVPNGTVADHLHGDRAKPGSLSWMTRLSIAVETANALTYLHHSDVIHRDVKTNNILLDSNFCVKVADFGLSRLFPTNVTHVSTAPQGTPGYVDPEYHECYQLTDKSDVYSFGVVLIELISSKPAMDITRHRHEINLSAMAMNKIQNHALHELIDPYLGFETDFKAREMISEVAELAFQCLQSERDMRPSMQKVLETLKGIQSEDWKLRKPEEVEIPSHELVLLKSDPPTLSPDSLAKSSISTKPGIDRSWERFEIDVQTN
ncbi:hypothetical protein RHMOL_Rhmol12G0166200 [Rhododendron molle]|uniref:Uncharacterized protein n=1 Tax=Rhododendron molle TaxID=49168 RepID=A0ACC0LIS7_RHOML|nr:hypothetical protein RHMOL_Rhmol12G0166200 [Rhododendron molle]